jgi:hypothetical protein
VFFEPGSPNRWNGKFNFWTDWAGTTGTGWYSLPQVDIQCIDSTTTGFIGTWHYTIQGWGDTRTPPKKEQQPPTQPQSSGLGSSTGGGSTMSPRSGTSGGPQHPSLCTCQPPCNAPVGGGMGVLTKSGACVNCDVTYTCPTGTKCAPGKGSANAAPTATFSTCI